MRKSLITWILVLSSIWHIRATHIVGGDFTYTCLGEVSPGIMRYNFILTIYRDCQTSSTPHDPVAHIGIHRGNLNSSILVKPRDVPGGPVFSIPIDTPKCVQSFPAVCLDARRYTFTEDLPIINQSYFVTYQRCCRNHTIRNLLLPEDLGLTIYVEISPLAQLNCNNSPVFKKLPRSVICNQLPLVEDQSATDADGDLLVYSFCNALNGGSNNPSTQGGCLVVIPNPSCGPPFMNTPMVLPDFTPTAPMGGDPVISINSSTGLITGTPNQLGQFVVAMCVQEFRNGQLIGSIRREFQYNLADCSPNFIAAMQADTILGPQVYQITTCGQKEIFFQNQSLLGNPPAQIEWRFDLHGQPPLITNTASPTVVFPDFGLYRGVLYLNPLDFCNDSAEVFIRLFPGLEAAFSASYDTCVAGPVSFKDASNSEAGVVAWQWNFDNGAGNSTDNDPDYLFKTPGMQEVKLTVIDKNGCTDEVDSTFMWQPAPPYLIVRPNRYIECAPGLIEFTNLSNPIDSTYHIVWDYGDGQRDTGIISPKHVYEKAGKYDVSLFIQSPIGCVATDTFIQLIFIVEPPVAQFSFDTTVVLNQNQRTLQFFNESLREARVGWVFDQGVTSTLENPIHTFKDTGLVQVFLVATHEQGCKDTISRWFDIVPQVTFTMPNAFTPNGDSDNDDYRGNGWTEYIRNFSMQIWNRWGELVYETEDPRSAWDGTVMNRGKLCPDGVYVYTVQYADSRGRPRQLKGQLHLLR